MTPAVVAIDPASTGYVGLARLGDRLEVERVRVYAADVGGLRRTWCERVEPVLARWWGGVALAVAEVPPPTMRKDAGRDGSQGAIGFGIGRAVGYFEHAAMLAGVSVELVPVGDVRRAMRPHLPPAPISAPTPTPCTALPPTRWGDGWTIRYAGCPHTHVVGTLEQLQRRPTTCPTCAAPSAGRASDARAAAKRDAWDLFAHWWPDDAARVASEAARGARGGPREPWTLPGCSDVADAAMLARWGSWRLSEICGT